MKAHTFARTRAGTLTDPERAMVRGALRGVWGASPHRARRLVIPGVPVNELSAMLPEIRHDPALQEACMRIDPIGPAFVLDLRADLGAEWVDRAKAREVHVVPIEARRTVERARDRGRSLPAKVAAMSEPGQKWRKGQ